MQGRVINLNLPENKAWENMIRVLSLYVAPFKHLTQTEIMVLGQLLFHYHNFTGIGFEERNLKLFEYDIKMKICTDLSLSLQMYENCLMGLKIKNIVTGKRKEKILNPKYILTEDFNQITFIIKST